MLFGGFGGAVERWPADFRGSLWTARVDARLLCMISPSDGLKGGLFLEVVAVGAQTPRR